MLLPANFLIGVGLLGAILLATRYASLGRERGQGQMSALRSLSLFLKPPFRDSYRPRQNRQSRMSLAFDLLAKFSA
jgi:hypothetical protein